MISGKALFSGVHENPHTNTSSCNPGQSLLTQSHNAVDVFGLIPDWGWIHKRFKNSKKRSLQFHFSCLTLSPCMMYNSVMPPQLDITHNRSLILLLLEKSSVVI